MPNDSYGVDDLGFFQRFAVLIKLVIIGVLLVLMLVPLALIWNKLDERKNRRYEAVTEISSTWGMAQNLIGPILRVPYRYRTTVWEAKQVNGKEQKVSREQESISYAYFLPKDLSIKGTVEPKKLHRGIYEAVVYHAACEVEGTFDLSAWQDLKLDDKSTMLWDNAVLYMMVSDLRGVRENIVVNFSGTNYDFTPGGLSSELTGIHAEIKGMSKDTKNLVCPFAFKLAFNGSQNMYFAPVGQQTRVQLSSTWPDPSFGGQFLPTERKVSADGFSALWETSFYGRDYPQQWASGEVSMDQLKKSLFYVSFISPVDNYRNVDRAVKYAVLFIVLIFTAFFLFEILAKQRIHPFQYILIGAAICLFYLCILALSELITFGWAYLTASGVSWAMISLYTLSVLKSGRKTLIIAVILAFIQAFLYITLQLQDYSFIFGTVLLLVVLAAVMFVTRKVDWYNAGRTPATPPPPLPKEF